MSVVVAAPAHAQGGVKLDLEVGFDNRYAPGQWTPVSIVVDSAQAISGTLEVSYQQPDGSDSLHTLDVEVAGGGRKQFHIAIPGPPDQAQVAARMVSDDEVLASAAATPLRLQDTALVGVLGDPSSVDSFIAQPSLTEMVPVALLPGHMDLGAPALSALSYVVAAADDLDALVPEQRDALGDWTATGGRLLVVADDPAALVWPRAAEAIEWDDGRASGADRTLAGDRIGVVAAGLGEVMVVRGRMASLDRDLLETALRPAPAVYSSGSDEFNHFGPGNSADATLMNRLRARGGNLRLSWFVGFLVVYLILVGPVNYLVLKRRGRKELLWVTVPVLAFVFSGFAYGLARGSRGAVEAATVGVVFATETGQEGRVFAGVTSGTGGDRTFSFPTKTAVAPSFLPFFGSNQRGHTRLTPTGADVVVETAPFSMHVARGTIDRFDGFIEARVRPDGDVLRYEVTNRTPHALGEVTLLFNSDADPAFRGGATPIPIRDLDPGASARGEFDLRDAGLKRGWRGFRLLSGGLRNSLLREARVMLGPALFSSPLVVADVERHDLGIRLDGVAQEPAARFIVASPIEVAPGSSRGVIPASAGRVDVVSIDGVMSQYNPGTLTLEGFQEAVFAYQPPAGIAAADISGGTVSFQSGGPRQDLERYDWPTGRWVEMRTRAGRGLTAKLPRGSFSTSGEAYFRIRANRHGFAEIVRFEVEPVIG